MVTNWTSQASVVQRRGRAGRCKPGFCFNVFSKEQFQNMSKLFWGAGMRALASHQCGHGSNPGVNAICGLSLLVVLSFALRGFSLGNPVFSSRQKPTFPNSNSIRNQVDQEPVSGCAIPLNRYLFYYIFNL